MTLIRITAPRFCAGVELNTTGRVGRCAPILHYMRGWAACNVLAYVAGRAEKGWTAEVLTPREVPA